MPIGHEALRVAVMCGYLGYVSANLVGATYEIAKLRIGNSPGTERLNRRALFSHRKPNNEKSAFSHYSYVASTVILRGQATTKRVDRGRKKRYRI